MRVRARRDSGRARPALQSSTRLQRRSTRRPAPPPPAARAGPWSLSRVVFRVRLRRRPLSLGGDRSVPLTSRGFRLFWMGVRIWAVPLAASPDNSRGGHKTFSESDHLRILPGSSETSRASWMAQLALENFWNILCTWECAKPAPL